MIETSSYWNANRLTIFLVKRHWWNIGAWIIRWALPVSRFKWARANHSIVEYEGVAYHATMLHGVVECPIDEAIKGQQIVAKLTYVVPDINSGIEWAKSQVGKPYDFKGAFGLSLSPDRIWGSDESWFCHEFCAGVLQACGLQLFNECGHVTDSVLLITNKDYDGFK